VFDSIFKEHVNSLNRTIEENIRESLSSLGLTTSEEIIEAGNMGRITKSKIEDDENIIMYMLDDVIPLLKIDFSSIEEYSDDGKIFSSIKITKYTNG